MLVHEFIFIPHKWRGQGIIELSMTEEEMRFFTRWTVHPEKQGVIKCVQEIEIEGVTEKMFNYYQISEISSRGFDIELDNPLFGKVAGKGVIEKNTVAWEFRDSRSDFEGFEVYEITENGYQVRAEYISDDQFRTIARGEIWRHHE